MRPILLVTDPPDPETLSTRKLVIETAKYNVLTSYTSQEAIEMVERVPMAAAVLHEHLEGATLPETVRTIKQLRPEMPIYVVSPNPQPMPNVDRVFSSFNPMDLVTFLIEKFGKPDKYGNVPHTSSYVNQY